MWKTSDLEGFMFETYHAQINFAHKHHILLKETLLIKDKSQSFGQSQCDLKRLSHCKCTLNQDGNVLLHHLKQIFYYSITLYKHKF